MYFGTLGILALGILASGFLGLGILGWGISGWGILGLGILGGNLFKDIQVNCFTKYRTLMFCSSPFDWQSLAFCSRRVTVYTLLIVGRGGFPNLGPQIL